jgi:TP901 family phage tail tape measure protein
MELGKYVAKLSIDKGQFTRGLNSADKEYADFCKSQLEKTEQTQKQIKKLYEQKNNVIIKSEEELVKAISNLKGEDKADLERELKDYQKYVKARETEAKKLARAEEASAKKILAQKKRDEAETARLIEKSRKDEERAFKQREAQRKREIRQLDELKQRVLTWSSIAITIPITLGTRKAFRDYVEFQEQLINVKAVTNATEKDMRALTESAIEMSQTFAWTGKEIASGFLEIAQAGYDASEILTLSKDIMILASAGMKDVAFTSELVVTTLKAFNMEAEESKRIIDVFASSAARSVSSLDKISASLKYTAGLWGSQNWEIENLIGVLDVLFDTGVRGEKAGRLLASAINSIQKPTKEASAVIKRLTGDVKALDPATNDIISIVKKLTEAGATNRDVVTIFGKTGNEIILRLMDNVDKLDKAVEEVTGQTGEAARQASTQLESLSNAWKIVTNKMTAFSKKVFGVIEPALTTIVNGIGSIFDTLNKLPDFFKVLLSFGVVLGGLAPVALKASMAIGGVIKSIQAMTVVTTGLQLALLPTMGILAGVGVAVGGIAYAYGKAKKDHAEWVSSVREGEKVFSESGKSVDDAVRSLRELYATAGDSKKVKEGLEELAEVFPNLRNQLNKNADDTTRAMSVLTDEYQKLLEAREESSGKAVKMESDPRAKEIAELQSKLATFNKEIEKSASHLAKYENEVKELGEEMTRVFGTDYSNASIFTILEKLSTSNIDTVSQIFEKASGGSWYFDGAIKDLTDYFREMLKVKEELDKATRTPVSIKIDYAKGKVDLAEKIQEIVGELETKTRPIRIKYQLEGDSADKEAFEKEYASAISSALGSSLDSLLDEFGQDLEDINFIDSFGNVSQQIKNYAKEASQMIESAFSSGDFRVIENLLDDFYSTMTGENRAGFEASLEILNEMAKKQKELLEVEKKINTLADRPDTDKAKAKQLEKAKTLQDEILDLSKDLESTERQQIQNLFALLEYSKKINKTSGKSGGILDWWEQIVEKMKQAREAIAGVGDVTSVLERLEDFNLGEGVGVKEVTEEVEKFLDAFKSNKEMFALMDNFNILGHAISATAKKVDGEFIKSLEGMGLSTAPELATKAYGELLNTISDLTDRQLAYAIALQDGNSNMFDYKTLVASTEAEIRKAENAVDDFLVSIGELSRAEANANKAQRDFNQAFVDSKGIDKLKAKIKEGTASLYEIDEVLKAIESDNLGDFSSITDNVTALGGAIITTWGEASKLKKEIKELKEEGAEESKAELEKKEFELKINKEQLKKELEMVSEKIKKAINLSNVFNDAIKGAVDLGKALKNADSTAVNLSETIESATRSFISLGAAITNMIVPGLGTAISLGLELIETVAKGIASLFSSSEDEVFTAQMRFELDSESELAIEALKEKFNDYGEQLADAITSGVKSGSSNSKKFISEIVFDMVAQSILDTTTYKKMLGDAMKDLWESAFSPDVSTKQEVIEQKKATAEVAKAKMDAIGTYKTLAKAESEARWSYENSKKGLNAVSGFFTGDTKRLEKEWKEAKKQLELWEAYNKEYQKLIKEAAQLQGEVDDLIGDASDVKFDTTGLEEGVGQITKMMESLYDALEMGEDDNKFQDIADGIANALSNAVISGDYSQFKKAVYSMVLENVVEAVAKSSVLKGKVETLVNSVVGSGEDFTMNDAHKILAEVDSLWKEATDTSQPLGQLFEGLRESMAQFGEFDINVNPANVVTAIPSQVQDKLVAAIESVAENLSQAITEAGLNSHINEVLITTAYITQMITDSVLIQNATFDMSGDIVLSNVGGESLVDWMESFVTELVNNSTP